MFFLFSNIISLPLSRVPFLLKPQGKSILVLVNITDPSHSWIPYPGVQTPLKTFENESCVCIEHKHYSLDNYLQAAHLTNANTMLLYLISYSLLWSQNIMVLNKIQVVLS